MMSVRYVNFSNGGKRVLYFRNLFRIGNTKYAVPDLIFRYKIIQSICFFCRADCVSNDFIGAVSQKNRPGLRIARVNVANPVRFLFRSGIFMLFNHAAYIIVNGRTGHNSGLYAAVHRLLIYVITGRIFLNKASPLYHIP